MLGCGIYSLKNKLIVVEYEITKSTMCFLYKVYTFVHMFNDVVLNSLWTYQMVEELHSQLTTGAVVLAALTLRHLLCRSAAVVAAVIHPVCPLFVLRNPRMVALVLQKICSMIAIKVRVEQST